MLKASVTLLSISVILQAFLLIPHGTSILAAIICVITDPSSWNREGVRDYFNYIYRS